MDSKIAIASETEKCHLMFLNSTLLTLDLKCFIFPILPVFGEELRLLDTPLPLMLYSLLQCCGLAGLFLPIGTCADAVAVSSARINNVMNLFILLYVFR